MEFKPKTNLIINSILLTIAIGVWIGFILTLNMVLNVTMNIPQEKFTLPMLYLSLTATIVLIIGVVYVYPLIINFCYKEIKKSCKKLN